MDHEAEKAAGSAVIPAATRVLLIKRGKPPSEGTWTFPGGRVVPSERLEDALVREVLEETGLVVAVDELVEVIEVIDERYHYVILDYLVHPTAGVEDLRAGDDAADARLVPLSELADYQVTDAVRRVIARALEIRAARNLERA